MQPGVMSPAELVFEMFANREMLGLTNICILLNRMIVMSPSNAHTERQIKFLNNIKTVHRTGLSQSRLNNQFKIAGNSAPSKKIDPQIFVDHYIKKSIEACEKKQKIVLRCGQEVPSVFNLKSTYKQKRFMPAKSLTPSKLAVASKTALPVQVSTPTKVSTPAKLVQISTPTKLCTSPIKSLHKSPPKAVTSDYGERDKRNKRNAASQFRAFFSVENNVSILEAVFLDKDGTVLKQIVEDWSKDPINNDPFFLFRQDPTDNFMCSVTKYDFAQVLSKSYVSDNFIATKQKLLLDYFEGSYKVLFLAPTLWTSLKMFREQARFRKDYSYATHGTLCSSRT